jgi:hypothetical protein
MLIEKSKATSKASGVKKLLFFVDERYRLSFLDIYRQ